MPKKYCAYCGALKKANADIVSAFQDAIDNNEWLRGNITAHEKDIIQTEKYSLLVSEESRKHILERHQHKSKPGSLFKEGFDLIETAKKVLNLPPNEATSTMLKWVGIDMGENIGLMGIAYADPDEVALMTTYRMPDGAEELVKIKKGKRKPTSHLTMVTSRVGELSNGTEGLILVTMYPGGLKVDGHTIPINRSQFAEKGLYFVVE